MFLILNDSESEYVKLFDGIRRKPIIEQLKYEPSKT